MSTTTEMLAATPAKIGYDAEALARCIEACFRCAEVCTACADACLAEEQVAELRRCVTLDLNCADVCTATGRVMARQTDYNAEVNRAVLVACRDLCRMCGDECASHASMHEHCRICAEMCRECEAACAALLG